MSEIPVGYKKAEVGVIPADWEIEPFENLAKIERGKFTARPRNDPKYYGGDIPFIQTGDVTNAEGRITTYSQTLNSEGLKVSKLFPRGTLFFTIAANIGDVGFADFDTACPDSLVAITPTKSVDAIWLSYERAKRKTAFEGIATHNAQLNINLEKLRPHLLPCPPLSEQRAIAKGLSEADAFIESLAQLLAKKRQLKQGTMQELLTGKKRLIAFADSSGYKRTEVRVIPESWEVKSLKQAAEVRSGVAKNSNRKLTNSIFVYYLRVANVQDGYLDLSEMSKLEVSRSDFKRYEVLSSRSHAPRGNAVAPRRGAGRARRARAGSHAARGNQRSLSQPVRCDGTCWSSCVACVRAAQCSGRSQWRSSWPRRG
ncbi:restriction endonuclease subunit S [uncultured Thiodictyon sp.]|uniref:restriction endonuclease subunit S n=1 Tax=uncultured Thiodictyon sp. TaxID=1846217 RepID=UPI0025EBDE14|nr:restriction endonuclease subunit S [uncultured Thiodictyon sp.]